MRKINLGNEWHLLLEFLTTRHKTVGTDEHTWDMPRRWKVNNLWFFLLKASRFFFFCWLVFLWLEKEERGNDRHEVAGIRRRRTIGFPRYTLSFFSISAYLLVKKERKNTVILLGYSPSSFLFLFFLSSLSSASHLNPQWCTDLYFWELLWNELHCDAIH